jgi:3-hydroxybutyrate dehydrogenase
MRVPPGTVKTTLDKAMAQAAQSKTDRPFAGRPFAGRHTVVTGGGRGIGAAIAEAFAARGADVTLVGRTMAPLEEHGGHLADTYGVKTHAQSMDVTDDASVSDGMAAAAKALGAPAILVNNAGRGDSAPFKRADRAFFQKMIDINLMSTVMCTQAVLPAMIEAGFGRIINVASTAGLIGYRYVTAYVASKHAVVGLTKALALETAKTGVTVNAVCPGYVETDMTQDTIANIVEKTGKTAEEAYAQLAAENPQARLILPEEVANAAVWVALPDSHSITGQAIAIAGGEVM